MTVKEILARLEAMGSEKVRAINRRQGAGDNQYGVKMGDIRAMAREIKTDHNLALQLWKTGNIEARFLAVLIMNPGKLSSDEIKSLVPSERFTHVADWLTSYVIMKHPEKESLRREWMDSTEPMSARAGWSLTSERVAKDPEGIDIPHLLKRIENEMPAAAPEIQWTMNMTLAQIGIYFKQYRVRSISIGEKLGIYRDFPVSKGCTSPFAPIWINEIVKRREK
ncbi:MAG: DNA alkylation repair protein [Bacteroidales bacterium]